jgi:hypothetical protein
MGSKSAPFLVLNPHTPHLLQEASWGVASLLSLARHSLACDAGNAEGGRSPPKPYPKGFSLNGR